MIRLRVRMTNETETRSVVSIKLLAAPKIRLTSLAWRLTLAS
jgi:hypothetical protein